MSADSMALALGNLTPMASTAALLFLADLPHLLRPSLSDPPAWTGIAVTTIDSLGFLAGLIADAGFTLASWKALQGEPITSRAAWRAGARRFLSYGCTDALRALVVACGLFVLVIPGLIALCALAVAPTVAVIEREPPASAHLRSAELTAGNRGRILVLLALLYVLPGLMLGHLPFALDALAATDGRRAAIEPWLVPVFDAVTRPFFFALPAALYRQLRIARGEVLPDPVLILSD